MNYTVNNQLRTSILFDGTAEARLADILAIMDTHTFGKREAAKIVGGIGRLIRLIEENKIRSDKPTCAQNGNGSAMPVMSCVMHRSKCQGSLEN